MSHIRSYVPLSSWGEHHLSAEVVAKFQYNRPLGYGSDADIFLESVADKQIAVKVAKPAEPGEALPEGYDGLNEKNWFLRREAALLSRFRCDHIVEPHGAWFAQDKWHLALDRYYCTLDDVMWHNRPKPMDIGLALYLCGAIGKALEFLHKRGFVHNDIKPLNTLLDPIITDATLLPRVAICDFAYTRLYHALLPSEKKGSLVGSPPYMAPEIIYRQKVAPSYRDMFALGTTLYEMVGGDLKRQRDHSKVLLSRNEVRDAMMEGQDVHPRMRHLLRLLVDPDGGIQDGMHLTAHLRQHYGWYVYEDSCKPDVWKQLFPPKPPKRER